METPRTELELREFYKDFSISSLKFTINLNRFLRYFCTEIGLFLMYAVIIAIPLFVCSERVLQHPLLYGFLYVGLQAICFKISTRNPEKLENDIEEFDFELSIFRKMIEEKR
jgi:hypothetical protein